MARRLLDEGDPRTCGDKAGTDAGVYAHRRAREQGCEKCKAFTRAKDRERYGKNNTFGTQRRTYARARIKALNELARRHPAEFLAIFDPMLIKERKEER